MKGNEMTESEKKTKTAGTQQETWPTIDTLSPRGGSTLHLPTVRISGSALSNVTTVYFGTRSARPAQAPTDIVVVAEAPLTEPGAVMVYVSDDRGNVSNTLPFEYWGL
jgi:hypothetical protein